jgi:hypothetical protein
VETAVLETIIQKEKLTIQLLDGTFSSRHTISILQMWYVREIFFQE